MGSLFNSCVRNTPLRDWNTEKVRSDRTRLMITFTFSSGHFSPLTDWVVGGIWGTIQQRSSSGLFCKRPWWAVMAWAGMFILCCCPSSISSADNGVAHPPRCLEGWLWWGSHGVWHAWTMQVSVSWQLPEEVPVDPKRSWSCSAPCRWSCVHLSPNCGDCWSTTEDFKPSFLHFSLYSTAIWDLANSRPVHSFMLSKSGKD